MNNVPSVIAEKIGKHLYRNMDNPIYIVKEKILEYFDDLARIEIDNPYVPIEYNFDKLKVPPDHPSRNPSNTFYKDEKTVLRTHMTCYLYPLGQSTTGKSKLRYIVCGDVYRKDTIDPTHYPVFHQMDAFYIVDDNVDVKEDLRKRLTGLIKHLFGNDCLYRFIEDSENKDIYFPFTVNSLEAEIVFKLPDGTIKYLEILGAGTIHPDIMTDLGLPGVRAWAFGLGLERLAMALFDIPDIRLFWSHNPKFLSQFKDGKIVKFKPFIKSEKRYKDISFYINDHYSYNDMCSLIKNEDPNDLIESVSLIDTYIKNEKKSHCYRINYKSIDCKLKMAEVNKIQKSIKNKLSETLQLEVR